MLRSIPDTEKIKILSEILKKEWDKSLQPNQEFNFDKIYDLLSRDCKKNYIPLEDIRIDIGTMDIEKNCTLLHLMIHKLNVSAVQVLTSHLTEANSLQLKNSYIPRNVSHPTSLNPLHFCAIYAKNDAQYIAQGNDPTIKPLNAKLIEIAKILCDESAPDNLNIKLGIAKSDIDFIACCKLACNSGALDMFYFFQSQYQHLGFFPVNGIISFETVPLDRYRDFQLAALYRPVNYPDLSFAEIINPHTALAMLKAEQLLSKLPKAYHDAVRGLNEVCVKNINSAFNVSFLPTSTQPILNTSGIISVLNNFSTEIDLGINLGSNDFDQDIQVHQYINSSDSILLNYNNSLVGSLRSASAGVNEAKEISLYQDYQGYLILPEISDDFHKKLRVAYDEYKTSGRERDGSSLTFNLSSLRSDGDKNYIISESDIRTLILEGLFLGSDSENITVTHNDSKTQVEISIKVSVLMESGIFNERLREASPLRRI